jgi:hypothetical protein
MAAEGGFMNDVDCFGPAGKWYKGNLHCHSTLSDGKLTPSEVVAVYRSKGYSFLSFTDHFILTDLPQEQSDDFLLLPGIEAGTDVSGTAKRYHILGVGLPQLPQERLGKPLSEKALPYPAKEWRGSGSAQSILDDLAALGLNSVICHPVWSRLEPDELVQLSGFSAIEIFNYGCELENHTGLAPLYWDLLLRKGVKAWGVATDDAHHVLRDQGGGWIMVKTGDFSRQGIMAAISAGRFYSSSGPEIEEFGIQNQRIHIRCSRVKAIHFVAFDTYGQSFFAEDNEFLTEAGYRIAGSEIFIRAECIDGQGRTAWSNPIFINPAFSS